MAISNSPCRDWIALESGASSRGSLRAKHHEMKAAIGIVGAVRSVCRYDNPVREAGPSCDAELSCRDCKGRVRGSERGRVVTVHDRTIERNEIESQGIAFCR